MIKMEKVRNDCLFVAFIDIENAYDIVNRKKLFEAMRGYRIQEKLPDVMMEVWSSLSRRVLYDWIV